MQVLFRRWVFRVADSVLQCNCEAVENVMTAGCVRVIEDMHICDPAISIFFHISGYICSRFFFLVPYILPNLGNHEYLALMIQSTIAFPSIKYSMTSPHPHHPYSQPPATAVPSLTPVAPAS